MLRGTLFSRCRMAAISMCRRIELMLTGSLFAFKTAVVACRRNRLNDCLNRSPQRLAARVWGCRLFIKLFVTIVVQSTFGAAKEKGRQSASSCRAGNDG